MSDFATIATQRRTQEMSALIELVTSDTSPDKDVEMMLVDVGLTWERVNLPLDIIDLDASQRYQVRVGPRVDDDTVLLYAAAMERGDRFPPIVACRQSGRRRLVVPHGVHRVSAAVLAGVKTIDAYVTSTATDVQVLRIGYRGNRKNGRMATLQDRLYQARHWVESQNMTAADAAAEVGVPAQRLNDMLRLDRYRTRILKLGILPPRSTSNLDAFGSIKSDVVLRAAAPLMDISTADAAELSKEVKRCTSEAQQLAVVTAAVTERAAVSAASGNLAKRTERTPYQRLTMATNLLDRLPSDDEVASIRPELRQEARKRTLRLAARLDEIAGLLA